MLVKDAYKLSGLGIFLWVGFDYQLHLFGGYSAIKVFSYFIEHFDESLFFKELSKFSNILT